MAPCSCTRKKTAPSRLVFFKHPQSSTVSHDTEQRLMKAFFALQPRLKAALAASRPTRAWPTAYQSTRFSNICLSTVRKNGALNAACTNAGLKLAKSLARACFHVERGDWAAHCADSRHGGIDAVRRRGRGHGDRRRHLSTSHAVTALTRMRLSGSDAARLPSLVQRSPPNTHALPPPIFAPGDFAGRVAAAGVELIGFEFAA